MKKIKDLFRNKKFRCFLITFLMLLSFTINLNYYEGHYSSNLFRLPVIYFPLFFISLYSLLYRREDKKINKFYLVNSIIISLLTIISFFYDKNDSIKYAYINFIQLGKSIICFIGYSFVFYYLLDYLFKFLNSIKFKKTSNKKIINIFDKHPFISSFLIILICYIPIMIIFYPGVLMGDGVDVLKQYYCIDSWSFSYINLINPNICINTHHSAFYTYIVGSIYNIVSLIVNRRFALFILTLLQVLLQASILSYTMKLLKKLNINYYFRMFILVIFCFFPFFNINAVGIYKDIPYCLFCLLLTDFVIEYISLKEDNYKKIIEIMISSIFVFLMSNKGLYIISLLLIILSINKFKVSKLKSSLFILPIIICMIYSKVLLPALEVTPGSIRETLSIPIQQVSRYVVYHGDELNKEEIEIIDKIIKYDEIKKRYEDDTVDPIKNYIFNKNYTKKELSDFIKLWIKLFFKNPRVYITAFLNQTIGVFDFYKYNSVVYMEEPSKGNIITDNASFVSEAPKYVNGLVLLSRHVPILGLTYNVAFYVWMLIILIEYLISKKNFKEIIPFIPSIVVFLFCFVSPVNGNKRYIYPMIYCLPILVSTIIYIINNNKVKGSN